MRRICLVGNSHLACIKLGWENIARRPDFGVTFFGAPGSRLKDLIVESGRLVPTSSFVRDAFELTSKGQTVINPESYDGFVLVGLRLNVHVAVALLQNHTPHTFRVVDSEHLISEDLLGCALADVYNNSLALKLARMLRQISSAPIILFPVPMPSDQIAEKRAAWAQVVEGNWGEELATIIRRAVARVATGLAKPVWQPERTIVHGLFTRREYAQNSPGLLKRTARSENDFIHMNETFGTLAMECILDALTNVHDVRQAAG